MNIADMLSFTDIKQLGRIAEHYNCDCSPNSKRELIQAILMTINQREIHEQIIDSSSIYDLRFLNSLIFEQRNSFSIEELIARAELAMFTNEHDDSWNPRDVIVEFKKRGWLFNGYSQNTQHLFQVPQDLKQRFSDVLADRFERTIVKVAEPDFYKDEQSLLQDDVHHFLAFVAEQDIMLTAEGSMYKRQLMQLIDRLTVKETIVEKEAWRFGYGRKFKHFPNRLSYLYDYCYSQRYIMEDKQRLQLTDKGQQRLSVQVKEDVRAMYRYWLQLYSKPIKNLTSFVYWISKLAEQWVTASSLAHILCLYIKPYYYDTAQTIFEKRIMQMMLHLGLISIGHDHDYGYVVRMNTLGQRIVQEEHDLGVKR